MADRTAPPSQLRLEWVYGYRGNQTRNNLFYTETGEVVYFVAGVAVVHNRETKKQRFFLGHSDDILCLAIHPNMKYIATAQIGKDPYICVWDSVTMETVSILQGGHQRGIDTVTFSADGELIASTGLDDHHTLNVWSWSNGKLIATARGHGDKILDTKFNPSSPNSLVTCGVKHIKFWTRIGNSLTNKKGIFGKKGELQTMMSVVFGEGDVVFSGTYSGDVYQWKGHTLVNVIKAHAGAIHTLFQCDDGYASGGRDGKIMLWQKDFKRISEIDLARSPKGYKGLCIKSVCWVGEKVLAGTKDGEVFEVEVQDRDNPTAVVQGHGEGELWALAVHHTMPVFATGSDDKTIRVWSIPDRAVLVHCSTAHAVRSLAFSPDGKHLAAGLQNGSFLVLDAKTLDVVNQKAHRKEVLHEMKYSPDGQYLAVGSNDNFVDIYSVDGYKRVGTCKGSSSFITHLDWSKDSQYIVTNSGASEKLTYKMPEGTHVTKREELDEIEWDTFTGVLGDEVQGVWPKYSQVNDVNATDACKEHNVIVTGDDFGLVKLFRFPSLRKGAKFRKYVGHSAHVTNVRFDHDKHHVISVGGADHGVFLWKFLADGVEDEGYDDDANTLLTGQYLDSDSEASDSELSDVGSLDSDIEQEQEKTYERSVYREDLVKLKQQLQAKEKAREDDDSDDADTGRKSRPKRRKGIRAGASQGKKNEPPVNSLSLEFVHGYRGYDCRSNLYYTSTGDIVYHVAALGIVYDKAAHKQRYYSAHTDDILCLTLHPQQQLVATGQIGRDPTVHIWDTESMETVSILQGQHSRGVCAVDFSKGDGKKLASIGLDDDHTVVVWDWKRGERLASTRGHKDKLFMINWNPHTENQLVTIGIKHIKFWAQAGGGFTSKRGVFGRKHRPTTMLSVCFGKSEDSVYSGGADGRLYQWKNCSLTSVQDAHKGPLFAMYPVEKGYLTGGKDGVVLMWDEAFQTILKTYQLEQSSVTTGGALLADHPAIRALALGKDCILVGTKNSEILEVHKDGGISILIQGHMEGEVWGLATHPNRKLAATASDDCSVRLWDLDTHRQSGAINLGRPARSIGFSRDGSVLAVGMKDGTFMIIKADTLEQEGTYNHRKEEISDVKFSPNGRYLAVASHDNFVDIYNIASQKRVGICKGPSSYITHVDWDCEGKLLQLNTGDRELLYFEAPRGKQQFINKDDALEVKWDSWTCVLGQSCSGIWPAYTDVTDINAACVSRDGQVICTGDDFGFVKLFKFPSPGKHAKCKQYVGHSAHVTNVRFTHDDALVLSTGGGDTSVMVWSQHGQPSHSTQEQGEETDSDSEDEGGFDSDVERERTIDYLSKTYVNPIRDATAKPLPQAPPTPSKPMRSSAARHVQSKSCVVAKDDPVKVEDLSLDFIYGYRGYDTRQNLLYAPSGEIVYHAAGAGIVADPNTKQQSFYLKHNDDIICLARNPSAAVVATGQIGRNAPVHVWDLQTRETVSILQGAHSVGVCSVDFSRDGKLLLCVGLDSKHSVTVWRWTESAKMAQASASVNRVFLAQFRPDSRNKFVSVGIRHVRFWSLVGSKLLSKRGSFVSFKGDQKMQTMLSLAFAPDDVTFTGSISGDVFVWKGHLLTRVVERAHSGPIFSMFSSTTDNRIISAGKERSCNSVVKSWDLSMNEAQEYELGQFAKVTVRSVVSEQGKILVGTQSSEILEIDQNTSEVKVLMEAHDEGELWGLATHPLTNTFITASCDKSVRTWSITDKTMLCKQRLEQEASSADISPSGNLVAVGLHNGEFIIMNFADLTIVAHKRDRSKKIEALRFSPNEAMLAVGSDDACVDVYSLESLTDKGPTRISYCRSIPSYVTHIDWSNNNKYLQVCAGYNELQVYVATSGKLVTSQEEISKTMWASWTSVLGECVTGIQPRNADKADVNAAHVNHSATAVATGDDYGCVKLFPQFPVPEKHASHKKFFGHSAHVANVRFSHDDQYLLSAGGDDSCVFVWKCQQ